MRTCLQFIIAFAALILFTLPPGGVQTVLAGAGSSPDAAVVWKIQTVNGEVNAKTISVGFGGSKRHPLISYVNNYNKNVRFVIPAVSTAGDCGSGNAWKCTYIDEPARVGWTSRMAVYKFTNSFKVGWTYWDKGSGNIVLYTQEYSDDLVRLGSHTTQVLDLDIYDDAKYWDWILLEPASLVFDEYGNAHMVMVVNFGGLNKIVYAYEKTNGKPTTPCNFHADTRYQCDVIYSTTSDTLKEARIVLTGSNQPRIAFFSLEDDTVKYAYPQSSPLLHPNCGPGGNTWRCITIFTSMFGHLMYSNDHGYLPQFDMAIGPGEPHFVVKEYGNGKTRLSAIKFVGSGGNCGQDYALSASKPASVKLVNRWSMTGYPVDGNFPPLYTSFDLAVDSKDYPVLAFNNGEAGPYYQLYVIYPGERDGQPPNSHIWKKVDGRDINTAYQTALALDDRDLALIGYIEMEDYSNNLKIAYQERTLTYVPGAPLKRSP